MSELGRDLINIEAENDLPSIVAIEDIQKANTALGVVEENNLLCQSDIDKEGMSWLSSNRDIHLSASELSNLKIALSKLPTAADSDSFVWELVSSPKDVDRLIKAVMIYRAFNIKAVEISERIGANDAFRNYIRALDLPEETPLKKPVQQEQSQVVKIQSFLNSLSTFIENTSGVFNTEKWSIGALLILAAAKSGIGQLGYASKHGWDLPDNLSPIELDRIEVDRIKMASSARVIEDLYDVNLLKFSMDTLSGLRRGVFEEGVDLYYALLVFGIDERDEEKFINLTSHIRVFLSAYDDIKNTLSEAGANEQAIGGVISLIALRRYLIIACEKTGLEWSVYSQELTPKMKVRAEDFTKLSEALCKEDFSAKLASISQDRGHLIEKVLSAAEQYIFTKQYWIDAALRVIDADDGIRIMDLHAILDMEPDISASTQMLAKSGVINRSDVVKLERHLEWMMSVYALPITSSAISKIIESRAGVISDYSSP